MWRLVLSGLILGAGICGIHCGILLTPVVARGGRNLREGMGIGLSFGVGKLIVYSVYGGIAAYSGRVAMELLGARVLSVTGGVLLLALGVWFFLRGKGCARLCRSGSPFMLGVVDGFFPCGPTVGMVIYIANTGEGVVFGILSAVLFGLGTLIVPVALVCGLTPYFWSRLSRLAKADLALRIAGGAVFVLWGLNLLIG